jgi:uncharacterized iron-regulated protein
MERKSIGAEYQPWENLMNGLILVGIILGFHFTSLASVAPIKGTWEGATGQLTSLQGWLERVQPGDIVVIGENHGLGIHQRQQLEVMQKLRDQGLQISVGLEFLSYTDQDYVRQYCSKEITEEDFLNLVRWGGLSFDFYRDQANFPFREQGAETLALNAPRSLTQKVSKTGLSSLLETEAKLLPPRFSLGRESYKQRFLDSIPHELPPERQQNYFAAQSIWDDTMAWRAVEFTKNHPDQVLVIVVGEFHVAYGGGLPDRILARREGIGDGLGQVWTLSQLNSAEQDWSEMQLQILPHPNWGQRADLVLVDEEQN